MKSKETRTEHPICYKMTRVSIQKRALQPSWLEGAFKKKMDYRECGKGASPSESEAAKSDRAEKVSSECEHGEQDQGEALQMVARESWQPLLPLRASGL